MSSADGWTIAMALEQFEEAGMPVRERNLRAIIRNLPGFQPSGKMPSGPQGGRGHPVYPIGELQLLHSRLADWLVIRDEP